MKIFYGWGIVAVSLVSITLVWGARSSFSVFYVSILKEFGWERAGTALIFSLFIFIYGIVSPISGWLLDRFGPKKIISMGATILALSAFACSMGQDIWYFYFFWGIMAAAGVAFSAYVPHAAVVSRWFLQRRGLVLGIISSGMGLGSLLVICMQYLINAVGWRHTYVLMAIVIIAVVIPLTLIFQKAQPQIMGLLPYGCQENGDEFKEKPSFEGHTSNDKGSISADYTLLSAMKTRSFWALFSCFFFFNGMTISFLLSHQVIFAVDAGYSPIFAASILSLYGATSAAGQSCGFITDVIGREKGYTLSCFLALLGMIFLSLVRDISHPEFLYLYSIFVGLGTGLMIPSVSGAAADLFHGRHFGAIYGVITSGFGFGGAISPWLGGYLYDKFHTYFPAIIISILSLCIACFSIWLAKPRRSGLQTERI
jgi:MFS family permease